MKTSVKIILGVFAGFAAGCVAGMFIPTETTDGSGKGDITKVSKFNRNVVRPGMSAFQERLTNDPEELKKTTASLTVLTSRMTEFDELVSIATLVSEGNEELASSLENLQKVKALAGNARTNGVMALDALNDISEGRKSTVDYEQASQNLALTYMLVDRQINIGKEYVCEVDAFLRDKNVEDYKDLALARDLWAGYCAGEAVLNENSEELEYWRNQESLLSSDAIALKMGETEVQKLNLVVLQQCMQVDQWAGLACSGALLRANDIQKATVNARALQSVDTQLAATQKTEVLQAFSPIQTYVLNLSSQENLVKANDVMQAQLSKPAALEAIGQIATMINSVALLSNILPMQNSATQLANSDTQYVR